MISEFISYSIADLAIFALLTTIFNYNVFNKKWLLIVLISISNALYELIMVSNENTRSTVFGLLMIAFFLFRRFLILSLLCKSFDKRILYTSFLTVILNQTYSTLLKMLIPKVSTDFRIILVGICETIIIFLFIIFISKYNRKIIVREFIEKVPIKIYILILIAMWVFILYLSLNKGYEQAVFYETLKFILTISMIIMIIIIVIAFIRIAYIEIRNAEVSKLLIKQVEGQVEYYQKLVDISYELRSVRHDLKNHLICIGGLIESNNTEDALEYIKEVTAISQINRNRMNTGNVIIDALLNEKETAASKSNILIKFNGFVPTQGITNTNLCIIFFNAVDNAIEACNKLDTDSQKVITIDSDFKQGYYFLSFKNPFYEKVKVKSNGTISTTKVDKSLHGYGLSNIISTVNRLGGETNIITENMCFKLNIILPLVLNNTQNEIPPVD